MLRANLKSVLVSFIALLGACLWPAKAAAVDTCNGNFVNPIGDICWDCMFPLSIGPLSIAGGEHPDTQNYGSPICLCPMPAPPFKSEAAAPFQSESQSASGSRFGWLM